VIFLDWSGVDLSSNPLHQLSRFGGSQEFHGAPVHLYTKYRKAWH